MTKYFSTRMKDGLDVFDNVQQQPPASTLTFEEFNGRTWLKAAIVDPNVASDPSSNDRCRAEVKINGARTAEKDVYYGYRMYLPSNFYMVRGEGSWPTGCVINQLKEGQRAGISLNMKDDYFRLTVWQYYPKLAYSPSRKILLPDVFRGEEVKIIYHVNSIADGIMEMWVNDELIVSEIGNWQLGPQDANRGFISRLMKLGLYRAWKSNPGEAYYTDAIVATTFDEVNNFLIGESIECPDGYHRDEYGNCVPDETDIIKRGCIIAFLCSSMGASIVLPSIRQLRSHLPKNLIKLYYQGSGFMLQGV